MMLLLSLAYNTMAGEHGNKTKDYLWLLFLVDRVYTIIAVGDSITVGYGDSDCLEENVKASCSGYTPLLRNLLTAARGYAHTIWEEGSGAKSSAYGRDAIQGIIDAHPKADQYLVMFGTVDANKNMATPSGQGLNQEDSAYPGTYKDNMQQIINKVKGARALPVLAKVPYAKDIEYANRNELILEYNEVIDELVVGNSIKVVSPDFYTYFKNHQDQIHSVNIFDANHADNIHPNHDGYLAMAHIWFDVLME